jgi:hypothetical protein
MPTHLRDVLGDVLGKAISPWLGNIGRSDYDSRKSTDDNVFQLSRKINRETEVDLCYSDRHNKGEETR